jgi:2-haloacid dehalogenase
VAARGCGFCTAFVPRPAEHGPNQTRDVKPEHDFDIAASDFVDLARQLGC